MTTDITELAQSLKAAAEKATPGQWERGDGKHGGELLVYCDDALGSAVCEATSEYNAIQKYQRIDNLDFIALANPENILALVEALEKAQQRITQMESRTVTVKLPDIMPPEAAPAHYWGSGESMAYADGYNKSAADLKTSFALSCSSAGVNVEFE
ncbi:TPA: ead/Ea22-like family protein [Klebsiella variicola]|nr:ead/Ea22-like family protein [Klebsiella variicola]